MEYSVIVAGTGFEGRAARIRLAVKPGMPIRLVPEPNNQYDENAIAVYIDVRAWFTLFMKTEVQIGYIKRDKAAFFRRKMHEGGRIVSAKVKSMYTDREHPRVSVQVVTDW
ncbi:HIRAN domain-containing protein [Pseudomonas sp. NPDC078700]|uniref:HIRAN domain-containing protein n=1 Tax=Pseudomonas sp. NPDC078700 TaxID=3364424 RepID=UPI0037C89D66